MKFEYIVTIIILYVELSELNVNANAIDTSAECASCNVITLPLKKVGEKCYYFEVINMANWFDASYFCNYHGMRLASILSEAENSALSEHVKTLGLPNEQRIWTSGTDLGQEGSWFWFSLGRRFTYTNWRPGQPDNHKNIENCLDVTLIDGILGWNDLPCGAVLPFICEA